ncbi:MAG: hypothetical protein HW408_1398 [Actinobacteria bacterium]|nr:hypothetical protein [Actinomycetota bacterium]
MRPLAPFTGAGGKSGLRRAGCRVIPGGGDPEDSATESIPPSGAAAKAGAKGGKGETAR